MKMKMKFPQMETMNKNHYQSNQVKKTIEIT